MCASQVGEWKQYCDCDVELERMYHRAKRKEKKNTTYLSIAMPLMYNVPNTLTEDKVVEYLLAFLKHKFRISTSPAEAVRTCRVTSSRPVT